MFLGLKNLKGTKENVYGEFSKKKKTKLFKLITFREFDVKFMGSFCVLVAPE